MSLISWLEKVPASIANFFLGFFNASKKLYNELSAEEQEIGQWGSGLIAVANQDLSASPDQFWTAVSALYPALTKDVVAAALNKLAVFINSANATAALSFEDALKVLQNWLSTHTSENDWIAATQSAVVFLISFFAPGTTLISKITMVLEYIYTHLVKPKIVVTS